MDDTQRARRRWTFAEDAELYDRARPGYPPLDPPLFRRYERDLEYTTGEYLDVLRTYSGHRDLGPRVRERMLARIGGLIDRRYGGRVVKRYLTELRVARRR